MSTYALNSDHDLYIANGQIARVSKSDAIMQTVKTRLLTITDEWFMDLSAGLPWYTEMLGQTPDLYRIRNYVAAQVKATEGVVTLLSLELQYNNKERKLDILFQYTDIYGNTIEGVL